MLTNAQLTWRTASLSKRRPQQREEILCWRQEGRLKHWLLCNCRRERGRGGERGGNSQNTVVAYREESCCKQTHHSITAQCREEEEESRRREVEEEEQADMEKRRKRSTRATWRKVEEEGRRWRMNQRICVLTRSFLWPQWDIAAYWPECIWHHQMDTHTTCVPVTGCLQVCLSTLSSPKWADNVCAVLKDSCKCRIVCHLNLQETIGASCLSKDIYCNLRNFRAFESLQFVHFVMQKSITPTLWVGVWSPVLTQSPLILHHIVAWIVSFGLCADISLHQYHRCSLHGYQWCKGQF